MTPEMLPWVLSRATGLVAVALLAGAMIAGLLVRTRVAVGSLKGAGMVELHRHLSLLGLVAIAAHGGALLFDQTVEVTPAALVVPGLIPYRPVATGLGVAAAELALLVHLSFRFRSRIGVKGWRRLHFATYAVFAAGVVHGILAGTDAPATSARMLYAGAVGAVAALTGWRGVTARRAPARAAAGARQTEGVKDGTNRAADGAAA